MAGFGYSPPNLLIPPPGDGCNHRATDWHGGKNGTVSHKHLLYIPPLAFFSKNKVVFLKKNAVDGTW